MVFDSRLKWASLALLLLLPVAAVWVWSGPAPVRSGKRPDAEEVAALPEGRVLLITLDGVREQDLVLAWPTLGARIRSDGWFYGVRGDGESMYVSNSSIRSFAGYSTIFTGRYDRSCWKNDCRRPKGSLVDALVDSGVPPGEIAIVGSWGRIERAVESAPRALHSVGLDELQNGAHLPEDVRARIAEQETLARASLPPWGEARRDSYTWAIAREILRAAKWRLAHVALLDSDEYGHLGATEPYLVSLREYERWILELLDDRGAFGADDGSGDDVSVVITTDHGRGSWVFRQHGWWEPTSSRIWAAVLPSASARKAGLKKREGRLYRQVDLRPTMELLLGREVVTPREGDPLVIRDSAQGVGSATIPSASGLKRYGQASRSGSE